MFILLLLKTVRFSIKDKMKTLSLNMSLNTCVHVFAANITNNLTPGICFSWDDVAQEFTRQQKTTRRLLEKDFTFCVGM